MRRNSAAARLAILSSLEYRINFAIDAAVQPLITCAIEVTLWMAILSGMGTETLGGYGREFYLAYALWANFVGRATANWMYEFIMTDEIDSGRVNAILMRPISFYEFYLAQFMGYKALIVGCTFVFPLAVCSIFHIPFEFSRLPLVLAMVCIYLVFTHTLSFCVACLAFRLNRTHSLTAMKNMAITVLAGELIPLDLYPEPLRSLILHLPFAAGVYYPVSFLTGRVGLDSMVQGFAALAGGLVVVGLIARLLWQSGIREYTGTGA